MHPCPTLQIPSIVVEESRTTRSCFLNCHCDRFSWLGPHHNSHDSTKHGEDDVPSLSFKSGCYFFWPPLSPSRLRPSCPHALAGSNHGAQPHTDDNPDLPPDVFSLKRPHNATVSGKGRSAYSKLKQLRLTALCYTLPCQVPTTTPTVPPSLVRISPKVAQR